jgi:hypothetical protein
MTKTLREKLDVIDEWLCGPDGRSLAAVLSATRGPDSGSGKPYTTVPIRRKAFPKLAEASKGVGWMMNCYDWEWNPDKAAEHQKFHFMFHARKAARVLGLRKPRRKVVKNDSSR